MWRFLLLLIDNTRAKGEKVQDIAALIHDSAHRQLLYVKIVYLLDTLEPIHQLQKELESGEPLLHRVYHLVNVNLQTEISSKSTGVPSLGPETSTIFNMLSASEAAMLKQDFQSFNTVLADKWHATCTRNLAPEVCGPSGLWKQAVVLDPFLKPAQSQRFQDYSAMFDLVVEDTAPQDSAPVNPGIGILEYWIAAARNYPHLGKAALNLLSICIGSVDAERSFSKLRSVQDFHSMSEETLRMQMTQFQLGFRGTLCPLLV